MLGGILLGLAMIYASQAYNQDLNEGNPLTEISAYFNDANKTDFLFLVDVSHTSKTYLDQLLNLAVSASSCFQLLKLNDNRVAVMAYSSMKTSLVQTFDQCINRTCLENMKKRVQSLDGATFNKSIDRPLDEGRKYLEENVSVDRKKVIFLLSSVLEKKEISLSKNVIENILKKDINLIIVSVGETNEESGKIMKTLNDVGKNAAKNTFFYLFLANDWGNISETLDTAIYLFC
ncbi:uncharacterized protein LOC136082271 [Hydra vulgaris]|uniref:Uncharacterized protein LOC136082271 n=1 Tax=Hydra vulgaris TaxID=6087 RepID=A0ABM4C5Z6_HYDVU